ncbi:MAG: hypothetical protein BGN97_01240 [Microbacterium sp. 69-10]|uniref:hypothetical protein n=1 Tax=Microbacterium sp. 69-10 TaxID=1895783 RepID=UPI0009685D60|nr:hypothetical protein [Microbacterium sp. 69-10]OJU40630.1 MAG: hypothetical protein BGN97_01240 [Microbacterium sp. 69-10]
MSTDASHRELAERLRVQARTVGAGAPGANAGAVDAGAGRPSVGAVFNIITRNANALDFEIPSPGDFARAATMLLRRGYG